MQEHWARKWMGGDQSTGVEKKESGRGTWGRKGQGLVQEHGEIVRGPCGGTGIEMEHGAVVRGAVQWHWCRMEDAVQSQRRKRWRGGGGVEGHAEAVYKKVSGNQSNYVEYKE